MPTPEIRIYTKSWCPYCARAKALLQQGMPDEQVLKSVLAEFPEAKTKLASIQSYKSQLKKDGLLPNKAVMCLKKKKKPKINY